MSQYDELSDAIAHLLKIRGGRPLRENETLEDYIMGEISDLVSHLVQDKYGGDLGAFEGQIGHLQGTKWAGNEFTFKLPKFGRYQISIRKMPP